MSVNTIGFVSMNNVQNQAEFMELVKNTINELVANSYREHKVQDLETIKIPMILNQARMSDFSYDVTGGRETFQAVFSLFIGAEDFSLDEPYTPFRVVSEGSRVAKEGSDAIPNEARCLFIHSNCMDYGDVMEGPKMVLSLGAWGEATTIIKAILDRYGAEYYFMEDDCTRRFEKVPAVN